MDYNIKKKKIKAKISSASCGRKTGTPSDPTVYCTFNKRTEAAGVSLSPTVKLASTWLTFCVHYNLQAKHNVITQQSKQLFNRSTGTQR